MRLEKLRERGWITEEVRGDLERAVEDPRAEGFAGEHSEQSTWELVAAANPDVIVCMPCGYDLNRAEDEAMRYADALRETGVPRIVVVDGSAYFSRPGPRLVDGLELLGHILHPDRVPAPETGAVAREVEVYGNVS